MMPAALGRIAVLASLLVAGTGALKIAKSSSPAAPVVPGSTELGERVRVVTFEDKQNWRFAYLALSARAQRLNVTVLGREPGASKISWGYNMGQRTAALKAFALDRDRPDRIEDDDVVLFTDATDVVF